MSKAQTSDSSIQTRDLIDLWEPTGNLYKSLVVVSRRARQISSNVKEELSNKLAEFASSVDNLEEIFENKEQIEISKFYEKMPKPTIKSVEEFLNGELDYHDAEVEEDISKNL
ncbi:MAG TPA: DNA-directed RNA polymerase subunit omega [Cyclobacteriaceae bacterium]